MYLEYLLMQSLINQVASKNLIPGVFAFVKFTLTNATFWGINLAYPEPRAYSIHEISICWTFLLTKSLEQFYVPPNLISQRASYKRKNLNISWHGVYFALYWLKVLLHIRKKSGNSLLMISE